MLVINLPESTKTIQLIPLVSVLARTGSTPEPTNHIQECENRAAPPNPAQAQSKPLRTAALRVKTEKSHHPPPRTSLYSRTLLMPPGKNPIIFVPFLKSQPKVNRVLQELLWFFEPSCEHGASDA